LADYQRMYRTLFSAVTDAITLLQEAQQTAEEIYISGDDTVISIVNPVPKDTEGTNEDAPF